MLKKIVIRSFTKSLLLYFILCSNVAFSQIKTKDHINISRTKVFIIPPEGFETNPYIQGLQKNNQMDINVFDVWGGNYYTIIDILKKSHFERTGASNITEKEIKVSGFPGKIIKMFVDDSKAIATVVFGDSTFYTMVQANYLKSDTQTENQIVNSLYSIYYDKSINIDPYKDAQFNVDVKNSRFLLYEYNFNFYCYTINGEYNDPILSNPQILIVPSPAENDKSLKLLTDIFISPFQINSSNFEIKDQGSDFFGNLESYYIEAYGEMDGKKNLFYCSALSNGKFNIIILANATRDFDSILPEFKSFIKGIRVKN